MALRLERGEAGPTHDTADPFARIQARLNAYPQARYDVSATHLEVHPIDPKGFRVALERQDRRWRLYCDDWHADFRAPEPALELFWLALSPAARLRVSVRGQTPYRWQLERVVAGDWRPVRAVRLPIFPFWRRLRIVLLRNHLLQAA